MWWLVLLGSMLRDLWIVLCSIINIILEIIVWACEQCKDKSTML